jgi:hypothetical protein
MNRLLAARVDVVSAGFLSFAQIILIQPQFDCIDPLGDLECNTIEVVG